MKFTSLLFASMAAVTMADGAVELTKDNFDAELEGKNAIVKFLAPW